MYTQRITQLAAVGKAPELRELNLAQVKARQAQGTRASLSTPIRPRCSSTIRLVTVSPSPVPLIPLVVWKGSKIWACLSRGIPGPLSITSMRTTGRPGPPTASGLGGSATYDAFTVTAPVTGSTASTAFTIRFTIA